MKKIFLIIVLISFHFQVFSQTEKGKTLIAASSNLNFLFLSDIASNANDQFQISFRPEVSWFVAKNLALGFQSNYEYRRSKRLQLNQLFAYSFEEVIYAQSSFTLSPQVTYFFNINDKFKAFAKGRYGLTYVGTSQGKKDSDDWGSTYGGTVGLSYFLSSKVATDFGLGYDSINFKKNNTTNNGLSLNIGFSLFL